MKKFLNYTALVALFISSSVLISCDEDEPEIEEVSASFTQTIDETIGRVTFVNTSTNATIYAWDFGDETTSNLENPVKDYTADGTYTVTLTASNAEGSSDMVSAEIVISTVIPDTEAPVITLIGDAEITISEGDDFTDPGATANDNVDGDISSSIVVTGTVNNTTIGTYTLDYDVTDAAGNEATTVSRTVIVVEKVRVEDGLLTNGDFEDGTANWFTNYGDNLPEIRSEGGNKFFYAEVTAANSEEPWAVNLSQVVEMTDGEHYILSFNASTGAGATRSLVAGIGLNEDPFPSASGDVSLTSESQRFELKLTANGFGGTNCRVLFDMNGENGIVVIDNVKLEVDPDGGNGGGGGAAPTASAPVPTRDASKVISIYSDSYTDLDGINYNPDWGQSGLSSLNTAYDPGDGNLALAYLNFNYQGTVLPGDQDLSAMRLLHVDIWVAAGTSRMVKVSPISSTGTGEFLVEVPVTPGSWNSVDLPIGDFTGMTWGAIKELKFDGQFNADGSANTDPFDIYLDNIYFFDDGTTDGGGGSTNDAPTTNAPTPTQDAANVISLFSDAYTNNTIDAWSATWDDSDIEDVQIDGNNVKRVAFSNFLGVQFNDNPIDASTMTHFHMDFYIVDDFAAGQVLNPKLSNHVNGNEVNALEYTNAIGGDQTGKWVSFDVELSAFNGVNGTARDSIAEFLLTVSGTLDVAYLDNIYFYKQ